MPDDISAPGAPHELRRTVGLWSAVAVVIGSTIGSGIFRSPAGIAAKLPGPLPMLCVWAAGGLFAVCGALTLAEIASALPNTGGMYVFCRDGWGRLAGFLFGWAQFVMIRAASLGAIAIVFSEYFFRVVGINPQDAVNLWRVRIFAAFAIALTAFFNIRGVTLAAAVSNVTVLAKYGGLVFIVLVAFGLGLPATGGHFTPAIPAGSFTPSAFGLALVLTLWAFDGWADLAYNAGEVKEPARNLPRALIGGTLAVVAIYMLANLAYLAVLPIEQIRVSKLVAADVAQAVLGPAGVVFVSVTVMISTFGTLNTVLFTSPRIFFAMAKDRLFFQPVASVHPRWGTPWVSISMTAALGIIFVLSRSFEQLADAFVTAFLPFYALGVASVFRLRSAPGYAPSFRAPFFPLVPLLFLASVLYLLVNAIAEPESRGSTLAVLGVVAAGIPVYYLTVGRSRLG
ncbi:MAG: APC family permease [Thermoanaerobaculia bacterium]